MTELSNYKYIKNIGEGTFGKVKLAIHILTGEKVAIKILQKSLIKGEKQYERIQNEIKYLKLLNHPNIIKIYEVIENDFSFFIVMEYATGGELFNYIVLKEKLSENETSFFFYQILQGVREIHSKKICHRDIKPENLLLANKKIIKIIDFGLSSEYDEFLSTPCGSPCYASPEMIKGKKYKGLSVDLWACGVILFAMLFGYLPFDDKDNNILFKKIIDCEIDFPEENEIDVGENAIDLIKKILNPDPEKRIGLDEVENHPFLKFGKSEYEKLFKSDNNFEQEDLIINYMENKLGFDNTNNEIQNDIYNNRHNHLTTTYYLLKQKCIEGRLAFSFRERLYKKITKRSFSNENKQNNLDEKSKKDDTQKINSVNKYQIGKSNDLSKINNNQKKSKTASRSESNKNLLSLKELFNKNDFAGHKNNIIIINNTNMIHEPEKISSIYNNIILKKNSVKNINPKIGTSVSQEKRISNNPEKIQNSTYIKSSNTYRANNKMDHIKVSLKKINRKVNKFIYYKKLNADESSKDKKYIKLPISSFSFKTNRRSNNNHNILSYKKNTMGNQTVRRYDHNMHSFDVNNSSVINFNSFTSNNNLNAFESFDFTNINNTNNFNMTKNNEKDGYNNINQNLMSNQIIENIHKNKNPKIKHDLNKEINNKDMLSNYNKKSKIVQKKEKFTKSIDKICRIIFQNNKKGYSNYTHYINNDKKHSYNNNIIKKKPLKKKEILINLDNSSNEMNYQNQTSRYNKIIKSINTFNINNLSNKILDKNILSKRINCYFIPNNSRYSTNANNAKDIIKSGTNILNNKINKNKVIQSYKNLSPENINNITYENLNLNINTFKNINKGNKINNNIKKILSPNQKIKKSKVKNDSNIYNILYTEKDLSKNKNNYIPITYRDKKPIRSRNSNNFVQNNETQFNSNTVYIDLMSNTKNNNKLKESYNEINPQRTTVYSKRLISNQKSKNANKFLVANTEMTLYQITNKIDSFCKENNLVYKKEGIYKIIIYNKTGKNFFCVEIAHSNSMNIVKIFHGKNTGNNMKQIITKLFIDIFNSE